MSLHLSILCLICINLHYTWSYAKFAKKVDFTQFLTAVRAVEFKWTVPIAVITYDAAGTRITVSDSTFVERWLPVSAGQSTDTPFTLWTGKLASNSLDLNPVDYSAWRARGDWKCGSGKCDTSKIAGVENAGVENAGVNCMEHQMGRRHVYFLF